jgi:D-arabinose 1-dehydrogenase-like Zn-dependent alcohol dehydrogenase
MNALYGHRLAGIFGYSHLTGGFAGGQAEYVRVPKGAVNLLPVPDGVPDEKVLYLSDVVGTSYHNVVDTGVKEGDVVAVWVGLPQGCNTCNFWLTFNMTGSWTHRAVRREMGTDTWS